MVNYCQSARIFLVPTHQRLSYDMLYKQAAIETWQAPFWRISTTPLTMPGPCWCCCCCYYCYCPPCIISVITPKYEHILCVVCRICCCSVAVLPPVLWQAVQLSFACRFGLFKQVMCQQDLCECNRNNWSIASLEIRTSLYTFTGNHPLLLLYFVSVLYDFERVVQTIYVSRQIWQ